MEQQREVSKIPMLYTGVLSSCCDNPCTRASLQQFEISTVTIAAGSTSAQFVITGVEDLFVDGDQLVTISVDSTGYLGSNDDITVVDTTVPALSLSIADASISESGGSTTGTVSRNSSGAEVTVTVVSSDESEAVVGTATIAAGANLDTDDEGGAPLSRAEKISQGIKDFTKDLNEATGVDGPRGEDLGKGSVAIPVIDFRENYGVRVFECFPQIVGGIDLDHSATDSIATFDVTWSYRKWNPFKMGNIGNRSTINLSVGEFRNEKDGFPFLEDLPQELAGPMTAGLNQNILTSPLSKGSNLFG